MVQLLVIEDDAGIRTALVRALTDRGHAVDSARDGMSGLKRLVESGPDAVVLDLGLPDLPGERLLGMIRAVSQVPVVVATARDDEGLIVRLLDAGADDYVVKPFSPAELVARVDAVLRRVESPPELEAPIVLGDLKVDPSARRASVRGEEVQLTVREFDLLLHFMRHPGQVFSRDQLMDAVWQFNFYSDTSTVTVHMRRLRAKIESDPSQPRWLQTVWGVGYRFQP